MGERSPKDGVCCGQALFFCPGGFAFLPTVRPALLIKCLPLPPKGAGGGDFLGEGPLFPHAPSDRHFSGFRV